MTDRLRALAHAAVRCRAALMRTAAMLGVGCALVGLLHGDDWPQFRGPSRDGICNEAQIAREWPADGPAPLWTSGEVGGGWASTAIVDDVVYTAGVFGDGLAVVSLDKEGRLRWKKAIGRATPGGGYKGSRSTPTVDGDRLYVLSDSGVLFCLAVSDGREVWSVDLARKHGAEPPRWFFAESVLVERNKVICAPGGDAALVALDKRTGEPIWAAPAVHPLTGYASAVALTIAGRRQIVSFAATHAFGVDPENGDLLWKHPFQNPNLVSATSAVAADDTVFCTAGFTGCEAVTVKLDGEALRPSVVWRAKLPDDAVGGALLVAGTVYTTCYSQAGFFALDLKTGRELYRVPKMVSASIIYANGRIVAQGHDGLVSLLDPADGRAVSSFRMAFRGRDMWAHPAISNGRLYIRHGSSLTCFDVRAEQSAPSCAHFPTGAGVGHTAHWTVASTSSSPLPPSPAPVGEDRASTKVPGGCLLLWILTAPLRSKATPAVVRAVIM